MNKSDLLTALAAKSGFTKKDAEKALTAFVEVISETLQKNDKVQLLGFGTFETRHRPARKARNPRTGEQIDIAPSTTVVFKAGKALRDSIQD